MIQQPQKQEVARPVGFARYLLFLRLKREADAFIYSGRPGRWIIDNAFDVQPGMQGICFEECECFYNLFQEPLVGSKPVNVLKKKLTRRQFWHV